MGDPRSTSPMELTPWRFTTCPSGVVSSSIHGGIRIGEKVGAGPRSRAGAPTPYAGGVPLPSMVATKWLARIAETLAPEEREDGAPSDTSDAER